MHWETKIACDSPYCNDLELNSQYLQDACTCIKHLFQDSSKSSLEKNILRWRAWKYHPSMVEPETPGIEYVGFDHFIKGVLF